MGSWVLWMDDELVKEEPKEPEDVKPDSTTKYFVIAVIAIFVLSFLVFVLSTDFIFKRGEQVVNEKVTYNSFVFENYLGLWNTQWQRGGEVFNLRLHYNPYQVENVSIQGDEGWNASSTMYITFDPEGEDLNYVALSAAEITLSLFNTFDISPIAACTVNATDACSARPIVNCSSPPVGSSVIYLKSSSQTSAIIDGGCVTIQGKGPELLRATEKVIYQWYGIIEPINN